jgi:hypothetical protein
MKMLRNRRHPFLLSCSLLLTGLAQSSAALAESSTVMISGGKNDIVDYANFKRDADQVYAVENGRDRPLYIVASLGQWKFPKARVVRPATSKEEVINVLKTAGSRLKAGETLLLFIDDHGDTAESEKDPASAKIVLRSTNVFTAPPKISVREFGDILDATIPRSARIKIVADFCYSGGLHQLAFNHDNIATAVVTDFRTVATIKAPYVEGFWREIAADAKTSLIEAHLAGLLNDQGNAGRGVISSIAYVQSLMKQGPYKEVDDQNWFRQTVLRHPSKGPVRLSDISPNSPAEAPQYVRLLTSVRNRLHERSSQVTVYDQALRDWNAHGSQYLARAKSGQRNDLLPLENLRRLAEDGDMILEFLRTASRAQADKFIDLLGLEVELI